MIGTGFLDRGMTPGEMQELLARAFEEAGWEGQRVLVIIPDGTRSAPLAQLFRMLYSELGGRAARLDYLIALGTHPPMNDEAIDRLVSVPAAERAARYPNVRVMNHSWDDPRALVTVGTICSEEMAELTCGRVTEALDVQLNRLILEYDRLMIVGPVFPHEVAGFSGGAKYLFPGIAGPDIINSTHWLGALETSFKTIGVKDTLVRRVIHRAAAFVSRPLVCVALAVEGETTHGLYIGGHEEAWSAAADLSAQLNIITVPHAFRRVLSVAAERYDDLWTAAKAMYKTEPAVADGGEIVIYAPHITEVSFVHGRLIDAVGYHVRDYFVKQPERFQSVPGSIKAHSTHVKGTGGYDAKTGVEAPRIQVTLATGIPEERCLRVNLGYADWRSIHPEEWAGREDEGILLVPHAGEKLYRAVDTQGRVRSDGREGGPQL